MTISKPTPLPTIKPGLLTTAFFSRPLHVPTTPINKRTGHSYNTLNDLFDFESAADHQLAVDASVVHSFFLPYDVLKSPKYVILPVFLITGSALHQLAELFKDTDTCNSELPVWVLIRAKKLGVALRYNIQTKVWHCVLKQWYGNATNTAAVPSSVAEIAKEMAYQLALVKQNTP